MAIYLKIAQVLQKELTILLETIEKTSLDKIEDENIKIVRENKKIKIYINYYNLEKRFLVSYITLYRALKNVLNELEKKYKVVYARKFKNIFEVHCYPP